jgi:transketolase
VRLIRGKLPLVCDADYKFEIGKAYEMRKGTDATIMAIGTMVSPALEATDALAQENIICRVLNMSTVKPIDEAAVLKAAAETGSIVTAEEHQEHGGLGSIVARITAKHNLVPMEFIAVKDKFGTSGKPAELLALYGLTSKDIAAAVKDTIKRKL